MATSLRLTGSLVTAKSVFGVMLDRVATRNQTAHRLLNALPKQPSKLFALTGKTYTGGGVNRHARFDGQVSERDERPGITRLISKAARLTAIRCMSISPASDSPV